MADRIQKVLLDYALTPGFQKTKAGLTSLVISQDDVTKALLATNKQALTVDTAIGKVNKSLAEVARNRAVENLSKNFIALEKETGDTQLALKELTADLIAIGASDQEIQKVTNSITKMGEAAKASKVSTADDRFGEVSRGVGLFGDVETGLRTVGVGGVAPEIFAVAEALPRLKVALQGLPEQARLAVSALGAGGIGLGAVLAGVAIAVKLLSDEFQRSKEATLARIQSELDYINIVKTSTTVQIESQIAEAQQVVDIAKARFETTKEIYAQELLTVLQNTPPLLLQFRALGQSLGLVGAETQGAAESYITEEKALTDAQSALDNLIRARGDENVALNDMKASLAELAQIRERILQLEQQSADLITSSGDQFVQTLQDRRLREDRAAEDLAALLQQQATAHHDRMIAIADAGQQRLEAIKTQGNERLAAADEQLSKLQQSLADVTTKLNADRSRIDRDYMASERAALEKFRQEEAKADAAYNKARVRRMQDLGDELLDAEEANDVVAFIAAKRAGEKDLKRMAEDADEATQQRQADFEAERVLAEQRRAERIADLEAAAAERRADIQAQIQERKVARDELVNDIADALAAEKKRIAEAQKAEVEAHIAQQKRDAEARDLRNKRQAEDEALADSRRRTALNKQLAEINTKIAAEKSAAQTVGTAWVNMASQVGNIIGGLVANIAARASSGSSSSSSSGGSGGGGQAFALGGIVTQPTIARIGDRPLYHEAIIPFRQSEGLDAALARHGIGGKAGYTVNFNAPISVGDGVSEAQLRAGLHELAGIFVEGLDTAMRS